MNDRDSQKKEHARRIRRFFFLKPRLLRCPGLARQAGRVDLVNLVYPVSLVQLQKRDRRDRQDKPERPDNKVASSRGEAGMTTQDMVTGPDNPK